MSVILDKKHYQIGKPILEMIPNDDKKKYYVATINNRLRELSYEIEDESEITLLDLGDLEACKVYETSLRYLFALAIHNLYPDVRVRFSYNVSRSIFGLFVAGKTRLDTKSLAMIKEEVDRLIEADIHIHRVTVSKEEAAVIYQSMNAPDKLEALNYRPESEVHLYKCLDYVNYMYGYMVPSTGYLKKYVLKLFSPGFIIQYPRSECRGEIPPFEDAPIFGKTLKNSSVWAAKVGVESIAKINQYVEKNGAVDFINMCESQHNNMLAELGLEIVENIDQIRLICIAGPSSSGKTTFSNRLRLELLSRGLKPVRISIDDYYLPKSEIPVDESGEPDLECLQALDVDLFNANMLSLIEGEEVQLPKFDFKVGHRVPGNVIKIGPDQPIIIEGIHALNDELTNLIPKHQKYKIYIAPQAQINLDDHNPISLTDLRLLRRIVRDSKFRQSPAESTISMWPSVRRGEFRWIYKNQENADYVFNSLLPYELCIMKKHALPVLNSIPSNSPYFIIANRLIKFSKYFVDLDDNIVPNNSIMREFIGDSCFEEVN